MTNHFKPSLLDRAFANIAPNYALQRVKAKAYMSFLSGGYNGASTSRKALKGWNPLSGNSDTDDITDLKKLTNRSYDLYRNNSLATGIINTQNINVVGTGLKLQSQIDYETLGLTREEAEKWQTKTEKEFRLWAGSIDCDATRMSKFDEIQSIAFLSALIGGDVITLLPFIERKNSPYSLAIKLLEGQHLCNKDSKQDTSQLAGGVEIDENGAPKNYHILKSHPGGFDSSAKKEWVIVPAFGEASDRRNVIHLFVKKRPGQRRGVPELAPVIEDLKQLGRYTEAELMAAVVTGMFTVFIKSELGEVGDGLPDENHETEDEAPSYNLAPGGIVGLAPGESIETANPNRPNPNFDPFVTAILRQIGAALQIPYELLIKHFTASYSASRGALLEAWKFFRQRRKWLADNFCQPIFEEWLTEAVSLGRIEAPGFFENPMIKKAYCLAIWNGDAPGQLDPVKETKAALMRCEAGFSTRTKEAAEMNGTDFDTNIDRGKSEREKLVEAKFIKDEQNA